MKFHISFFRIITVVHVNKKSEKRNIIRLSVTQYFLGQTLKDFNPI